MISFRAGIATWLMMPVLFVSLADNARAGIVSFSLIGDVTFADEENFFGLQAGDTITASGEYDDSFYSGVGLAEVPFGEGTGNSLKIQLGEILLEAFQDVDFLDGFFPSITFFNGQVADTNFEMVAGENDSPVDFTSRQSFLAGFFDTDGDDDESFGANNASSIVAGDWRVVAVPEPSSVAALTLMAAGILFGAVRRRRNTA